MAFFILRDTYIKRDVFYSKHGISVIRKYRYISYHPYFRAVHKLNSKHSTYQLTMISNANKDEIKYVFKTFFIFKQKTAFFCNYEKSKRYVLVFYLD